MLLCSVALILSSALLIPCLAVLFCALPWVCSAAFGTKPHHLIPLGDKGGSGNKGGPNGGNRGTLWNKRLLQAYACVFPLSLKWTDALSKVSA